MKDSAITGSGEETGGPEEDAYAASWDVLRELRNGGGILDTGFNGASVCGPNWLKAFENAINEAGLYEYVQTRGAKKSDRLLLLGDGEVGALLGAAIIPALVGSRLCIIHDGVVAGYTALTLSWAGAVSRNID